VYSAAEPAFYAVGAFADLLERPIVGNHGDDDPPVLERLRGTANLIRTEFDQLVGLARRTVVHPELETRGEQAPGHGLPHRPQPDESNRL